MSTVDSEKNYFDHEADIGIIGYGATLEAAFINAAEAVFAIMTDIEKISPQQQVDIEFTESDEEIALVQWLNQLLTQARIHGIVLGKFVLQRKGDQWFGKAWGEPWHESTNRGTEVKGATLTMLSIIHDQNQYVVQCVVDV